MHKEKFGSFSTLGGSPYGRISTIEEVTSGVPNVSLVPTPGLAGVISSVYLQHVEILRKAYKGVGTDEDAIVIVIARTTNQEKAIIRRLYTQKYNKYLVLRLQSEIIRDFKETVFGIFMIPNRI